MTRCVKIAPIKWEAVVNLKRWLSICLCILMLFGTITAAVGEQLQPTNLPVISITLDNGASPALINKQEYLPAVFTLAGAEGLENMVDVPLSIKGRGNSTWGLEKKPFALKFSEKTNLMGMGKAKKWVLLANYYDKTLLRNALTLTLGKELGIAYTPEWRFVDLYLNGSYQGNYLLTEKVEIGKERVNIDDENGGVLFEIEQQYRHDDCTYCHETPAGVHLTYKEPEEKDLGADSMTELMKDNNAFLDALEAAIPRGIEAYSQYLDVDSFVNWYILNEFAKNYDSAFVTSCYCYRDAGGKLCMGPPWDYDTCYGNQDVATGLNPVGYHVRQAPWYALLCADQDFLGLLRQRWTALADGGFFERIGGWLEEQAAIIASSQKLEQARWPGAMALPDLRGSGPVYQTYEEELAYLKRFIQQRTEWLDSQWNTRRLGESAPLTYASPLTGRVESCSAPEGMPGESVESLFDGDPTTKYCTHWSSMLRIVWKMAEPVTLTTYVLTTANDAPGRDPNQWMLQGSMDGEHWTTVDNVRQGNLPDDRFGSREFVAASPGEYLYYRLAIGGVKASDGYIQLADVSLGGYNTANLLAVRQGLSALGKSHSLTYHMEYRKCGEALANLSELERLYISDTSALDSARALLEQRLGDVDENGRIDSADALLVLQHSVQLLALEEQRALAGEVSGDGQLDSADALLILQRSVGLVQSFFEG